MHQHLSQALKTQSRAIESTLEKQISWKEIVNAAFLSEFNLLDNTKDNVRSRPWTSPANQELSTTFFKLIQAEETFDYFHTKIQSLVTYIKEESRDPLLAYQINQDGLERGCFNAQHMMWLQKIPHLQRFQSSNLKFFYPGKGLKRQQAPVEEEDGLGEWKNVVGNDEDGDSEGEEEQQEEDDSTVSGVAGDR
ncbi:hypothetical protein L218DRAFT_975891 [Marasmius fiardii PR-910]|nr:hypothetical protein L218DRAFT_975891 [Marasmius fiardii PR-910]